MKARDLIQRVRAELRPGSNDNAFVTMIERGAAPRAAIRMFAAEEHHVVSSDTRTFLTLATKASEPRARDFFMSLAAGEAASSALLPPFANAAGMSSDELLAYEPSAGCQAFSAYEAWLAMNGETTDVILAYLLNISEWDGSCARMATGLRQHYGFGDEACGFVDFFATPDGELEDQAVAAVQAALDAGWRPKHAVRYGRLLQAYDAQFWATLVAAA
jgi:thiaminase